MSVKTSTPGHGPSPSGICSVPLLTPSWVGICTSMRGIAVSFAELRPWRHDRNAPSLTRDGRPDLSGVWAVVTQLTAAGSTSGSYARSVAAPSDGIIDSTAETYRNFAAEASGRSPQYEELALAVAGDTQVLGFLVGLPAAKRQPNLLFAAARFLLGEAPDGGGAVGPGRRPGRRPRRHHTGQADADQRARQVRHAAPSLRAAPGALGARGGRSERRAYTAPGQVLLRLRRLPSERHRPGRARAGLPTTRPDPAAGAGPRG